MHSTAAGSRPKLVSHRQLRPAGPHLELRKLVKRPKASDSSKGSTGLSVSDMEAPKLTFPPADAEHIWSWQKAPAKVSLQAIGKADQAAAWSLNLIEAIHWFSFPLGFYVAGYVVVHAKTFLPLLGDDPVRLYLLVLGHLTQVFGGGITGNMMHTYEGWQVTPFRNILTLPTALKELYETNIDDADLKTCRELLHQAKDATQQVNVDEYNNAWLRSVAYQLLFMFQGLGIAFNSLAIAGFNICTVAASVAVVITGLAGPRHPRMAIQFNKQPVTPLPVFLFFAFLASFLANVLPTVTFYGAAVTKAWPPTAPWWVFVAGAAVFGFVFGSSDEVKAVREGRLPVWTVCGAGVGALLFLIAKYVTLPHAVLPWLALLAPVGVGAGGIIEGLMAESTFNQLWHWRAFLVLLTGFGLYGLLYWHMVA